MTEYDVAYKIAYDAHKGQTRWGGEPYITHPIAVANKVVGKNDKVAALLHDVIEDTEVTAEQLLEKGVSKRVVEAVEVLTHREGEPYWAYIKRAAHDYIARRVKIADLEHNLSDLNKYKDKDRIDRYNLAMMYLKAVGTDGWNL